MSGYNLILSDNIKLYPDILNFAFLFILHSFNNTKSGLYSSKTFDNKALFTIFNVYLFSPIILILFILK